MTSESIREALKAVKYPGYSRDIVSFGLVKDISAENGAVAVVVELTGGNADAAQQIKNEAEAAIREVEGVKHVYVDVKAPQGGQTAGGPQAAATPQAGAGPNRVQGIKQVVAVASGKGGVGKSTVSANLACALTQLGVKVGLLDCDIYGPSIPLMMGVNERPSLSPNEKLLPLENHGVKLMSMGFLLEDDQPVIWRGPMIMKTIQQFIGSVEWGELDLLLVDLPPGTGDAQLSLCQTVPLDGGVIVTTPQEASLGVVRKGINMFRKVNVPILGIVENMSYFTTPQGERIEIFGNGGGKDEAKRQKTAFLGDVPIFQEIREGGDEGFPIVAKSPESAPGSAFLNVAKTVQTELSKL
ncbi:Mrp/NBP35 family ATP-binding protein [bacterium]|jgi:ATP-binding protein involved in chromosome partitioning|nr:Mrp/NBP35 family ATP-binding protein [bacterium]